MPETAYLLALHSLYKLSDAALFRLLAAFGGSAEAAWRAPEEWCNTLALQPAPLAELLAERRACDVELVYAQFLASGASVVTFDEARYPAALKALHSPPYLLFYKGQLPTEEDVCLAMIGSRKASAYGRQVAELLARDLALAGLWIVSGLARGVDGICHREAVKAGGKTVAVLGSGLDVIYPREHAALYEEIVASGAVISEFPLGTPPAPGNFPQRNRLISGLSRGVLVVEAGRKSGTQITVDFGLEQGKDIYAVPGPITSAASLGTNRLLREGAAALVLEAADVWQNYLDKPRPPRAADAPQQAEQAAPQVAEEEQQVLSQMVMPCHFDELAALSGWPAAKLSALLTMWEIRGLIRQLPGKYYQLKIKRLP